MQTHFQKIIKELISRGFTRTHIGALVGMSIASIAELATGKTKSTSYENGVKIMKLHKASSKYPITRKL